MNIDPFIAVGVIFLFLSLIASTILEMIRGFTRPRGNFLRKRLEKVVNDDCFMRYLTTHPLFEGLLSNSSKKKKSGKLAFPSYLSPPTFTKIVLDYLGLTSGYSEGDRKMISAIKQGRRLPPGCSSALYQGWKDTIRKKLEACLDINSANKAEQTKNLDALMAACLAEGDSVALVKKAYAQKLKLKAEETDTFWEHVASASTNLPGRRLATVVQRCAGDFEHIESWYNEAMERLIGSYKRSTQVMLFIIGFVIAVLGNFNAIKIVDHLAKNPAVSSDVANTVDLESFDLNTEGAEQGPLEDHLAKVEQISVMTGLPVGWNFKETQPAKVEKEGFAKITSFFYNLDILGWLLTAIAISLGAPFWFDVLNKLVRLKSSGGQAPDKSKASSTPEGMEESDASSAEATPEDQHVEYDLAEVFAKPSPQNHPIAAARLADLSNEVYEDYIGGVSYADWLGAFEVEFIETPKEDNEEEASLKSKFLLANTQCAVLSNSDSVIIAFRGTEPDRIQDIVTDLQIGMSAGDGAELFDGEVHKGFQEALNSVWPQLQDLFWGDSGLLKAPKQIFITGHSLGGALATLTAAYLLKHEASEEHSLRLYTYGSPRVGNKAFAKSLEKELTNRVFRYVNECDPVTVSPPLAMKYRHVGPMIYLDESGFPVRRLTGLSRTLSLFGELFEKKADEPDTKAELVAFAKDSIGDHDSGTYQSKLEAIARI